MKVLFTSAEVAPFAKVGGLADVVGSLPAALRRADVEVDTRVIMPGYGFIEHFKYNITHLFSFDFTHRSGTTNAKVFTCVYDGVPHYFVQAWPYFGEDSTVYTEWNWDVPRFIFFNQLVIATIWELKQRLGWFPDMVHANDWHTGLVPFLIAENHHQADWARVATMMTIHNMAYQGPYVGGFLWMAGVHGRHHPDLVYQDLTDNLLAISLAYSDIITTVSPRYAIEIHYPHAGYGLEGLIRRRTQDVYGILNGLDMNVYNPETDKKLVKHFNAKNFETERIFNKRDLQAYARLPVRDDVPLVGLVSRLTWQKGIDLALPALRQLAINTDFQFVVLGTGEEDLEQQLWRLSKDFHWKVAAFLQFDGTLAQRIYAGSDIFLMPSRFEPCGMGQMIAMRYGSLPVVRETGGLADTVINYDNAAADIGTGFVFQWEEPDAVLNTLRWAIISYYDHQPAWTRMQKRGMTTDFSWEKSALEYIALYKQAINRHQ